MGKIEASTPQVSVPAFDNNSKLLAKNIASIETSELKRLLKTNDNIALKTHRQLECIASETAIHHPALLSYTGIVFKKIRPADFSTDDFYFAHRHLFITSFLYGLVRPLDLIAPYRLEGRVKQNITAASSLFDYWKPILTDYLIDSTKADDGVLINLASEEMKSLFQWNRIEAELKVIEPHFSFYKNGEPNKSTVYTKMCRGGMTRFIIKNKLLLPEELEAFEPYIYLPELSGVDISLNLQHNQG